MTDTHKLHRIAVTPVTPVLNALIKFQIVVYPTKNSAYYELSPQIAETVGKHETLQLALRTTQKVIVKAIA